MFQKTIFNFSSSIASSGLKVCTKGFLGVLNPNPALDLISRRSVPHYGGGPRPRGYIYKGAVVPNFIITCYVGKNLYLGVFRGANSESGIECALPVFVALLWRWAPTKPYSTKGPAHDHSALITLRILTLGVCTIC